MMDGLINGVKTGKTPSFLSVMITSFLPGCSNGHKQKVVHTSPLLSPVIIEIARWTDKVSSLPNALLHTAVLSLFLCTETILP